MNYGYSNECNCWKEDTDKDDMSGIAITFVVLAIILGIGGTILTSVRPYELITYALMRAFTILVMILMIFIVSFIAMKDYPTKSAFASSCFITTLLAILLRVMGALADMYVFLCIFMTLGALAFIIFGDKW